MSSTDQDSGRIVVGVDGSPSAMAALEWAGRQAELAGGTLELVTAWQWPTSYGFPTPVATDFDPAADAAKVVDEAVSAVQASHPDLKVTTTIREGYAHQVLVDASAGAELLVVGSRGHGELAGLLLGSVSEHCVTHAHCPVLVLRS